jgi:hypothetical protein
VFLLVEVDRAFVALITSGEHVPDLVSSLDEVVIFRILLLILGRVDELIPIAYLSFEVKPLLKLLFAELGLLFGLHLHYFPCFNSNLRLLKVVFLNLFSLFNVNI